MGRRGLPGIANYSAYGTGLLHRKIVTVPGLQALTAGRALSHDSQKHPTHVQRPKAELPAQLSSAALSQFGRAVTWLSHQEGRLLPYLVTNCTPGHPGVHLAACPSVCQHRGEAALGLCAWDPMEEPREMDTEVSRRYPG